MFILVAVYNDACDTVDVSCAVLAAVAELGVAFQKIIHKHVVASPTQARVEYPLLGIIAFS